MPAYVTLTQSIPARCYAVCDRPWSGEMAHPPRGGAAKPRVSCQGRPPGYRNSFRVWRRWQMPSSFDAGVQRVTRSLRHCGSTESPCHCCDDCTRRLHFVPPGAWSRRHHSRVDREGRSNKKKIGGMTARGSGAASAAPHFVCEARIRTARVPANCRPRQQLRWGTG